MNTAGVLEFVAAQIEIAASLGLRVAVAESLTGGLLADAFVSVPGASRVFSGGIVAYDTSLKHSLLGVDAERLLATGPVDSLVAQQMALGVRRACAVASASGGAERVADIGLATTGVAGPDVDPATGQPAGTVWLGVSSKLGNRSILLRATGDRAVVRAQAVRACIAEFAVEVAAMREI